MIRAWLADDIGAAVTAKGCVLTQAAWAESVQALDLIIEGLAASSAWGLEHTPGARKGFSRTLDARALVTYLLADQDLEYKQKEAIECASELFEVNPDDIRKYTGLEPINKESAARLAYFALVSNGLLDKAERYFDTEALRDFEEEGAEWRLELARLLGSDTDNV